jgi:hypothetical protein
MCASQNCQPRDVKVAQLQGALRADGVSFDVEERTQQSL